MIQRSVKPSFNFEMYCTVCARKSLGFYKFCASSGCRTNPYLFHYMFIYLIYWDHTCIILYKMDTFLEEH